MSKENLEQFMEQVAGSEELQAKIGEEIDAEALIALGAECGCEFTAEELQDSAELSDEELDTVAGGVNTEPILVRGRGRKVGRAKLVRCLTNSQTAGFDVGPISGKWTHDTTVPRYTMKMGE